MNECHHILNQLASSNKRCKSYHLRVKLNLVLEQWQPTGVKEIISGCMKSVTFQDHLGDLEE